MTTPDKPDQAHPAALRRAEAELARHLEEACEDHDREQIEDRSTDELLQLEEELLAAARAAGQAVRLRRQLGVDEEAPERASGSGGEPAARESCGVRVREFRTSSGSEWRVWEVRPGAGGRPRKAELYPVEFSKGWLAFELLDGERRKRLPDFTPEWCTAPDAHLEALLERATDVPTRKPRSPNE